MSHDLLDRLMAALHRNPELEFQLWLTMQKVQFYGPWKQVDEDWLVEDIRGNLVATVQPEGVPPDGFTWATHVAKGVWVASLEAGMRLAEKALAGEGWRRVPDELWDPEPKPEPKPTLLTPWLGDGRGEPHEWFRFYRTTETVKARVFTEEGRWKGQILHADGKVTTYTPPPLPTWNTVQHAKYGVDRILYEEGIILLNEVEPDPEIPF